MAVIKGIEDIHVKIQTGNRPITEYEVPTYANFNSLSNNVTKYIQAAADEEFSISLLITSEYIHDCPTLGFNIFVDGVKVASKCCLQSKRGKVIEWKLLVEGTEMGELALGDGQFRPFMFSSVAMSSGTGEIIVELQRRGEGKRINLEAIPDFYAQHALEALTGRAAPQVILLGHSRPMSEPVTFWYAPLLESLPLGVFHFKYRSADDLRHRFAQTLPWSSETERAHSLLRMPLALAESMKQEDLDADYTAHGLQTLEECTPRVRIKREYDDDDDNWQPKKRPRKSLNTPDFDDDCNEFEGSKESSSGIRSTSIDAHLFRVIKLEREDDEMDYARGFGFD